MTSDCFWHLKHLQIKLPKEKRDKVGIMFYIHNQLIVNGTDLPKLIEHLCPDLNIIFSTQKLTINI